MSLYGGNMEKKEFSELVSIEAQLLDASYFS